METTNGFANKVAIVTGGGTGLGEVISMTLAARGAKVVVASRSHEHLQSVVDKIEKAGGVAVAVPTDVREPGQVEHLVKETIERFGQIDILVNNAAGNFLVPAETLSVNGWNSVIGIVLNGTWYCSSFVGKEMIKQGSGSILNVIATYAWTGAPGVVHSASAKAGVLAMTRTLAAEWGPKGIRVNALAPGVMATEGASSNLKFDSPETQKAIAKQIPLRRLASLEEIANLAVFLSSDDAAYITGDVMTADGGRWLERGFLDLLAKAAAR